MSELPTIEPRKAVAKCGLCDRQLFTGDHLCKAVVVEDACPLKGERWQSMERARSMQNTYGGGTALDVEL